MFKLSIVCPQHGLPYEHVVITANNPHFLRCKGCPFEPTSLRIGSEQDYMKARMGQDKTKQREKSKSKSKEKSRSNSKGKSIVKAQDDEQENEKIIIQKIAEEQVRTLELVMKLLTEDKKKYYQNLEKSIQEHQKLWKQYDESTRDVIFLNKICKNQILNVYMSVMSQRGWVEFKEVLKKMHGRSYISKRITKQSKDITEVLKKEGKICDDTVLKTLETILGKFKESMKEQEPIQQQPSKNQSKSSSKRSKSVTNR